VTSAARLLFYVCYVFYVFFVVFLHSPQPNPYRVIRPWGVLPAGRTWGAVSAIGIDRDGRSVWVAERCGGLSCVGSTLAPVMKLSGSGEVVASFGAGMFDMPHGMHVDAAGNIWVTDARAHFVVKFNPAGQVLMTLGTPGRAGNPGAGALTEPCDVVTAPNGDTFVAEGHHGQDADAPPATIARVSKFSRDGRFIKSWGTLGSAPGQFRTPHALAMDASGRLFVGDRGNDRIQLFDQNGTVLGEWKQFSRVSGLDIDAHDTLYATDSESSATIHPGWNEGVRIGSVRDGHVLFFVPGHTTEKPEGSAPEGVAVDAAGAMYGAEVGVRGLTKFVRR
jgi:sugar lactone lactonase YvrE